MRVLFTFIGGNGHFVPLIPVAREALAKGHAVAFGCGPSMVASVQDAGFAVFPLGTGTARPPPRLPLRPLDPAREDREFRDRFAQDGAAQRAPHTLSLCRQWQPDVLVCDETDFGGMVAAECQSLPYATVLVMAAGSFVRAEVVGAVLNELRTVHDLPPDPGLAMLSRYLTLSPFPPGFRDPAYPLPATGHSFRPADPRTMANTVPSWLKRFPDLPVIYFTLGTVFNMESGDLFMRVLAGLRDLPLNVIVTVGPHFDPSGLDCANLKTEQGKLHIEQYIAQDTILPHCRLVISHGGSGSVGGALLHGLPSVLIPMGADQPLNAARCRELGLARVLDPISATPHSVRAAVTTVLNTPAYRKTAQRFRGELLALPGPDHAVRLLERLASSQRPVHSPD